MAHTAASTKNCLVFRVLNTSLILSFLRSNPLFQPAFKSANHHLLITKSPSTTFFAKKVLDILSQPRLGPKFHPPIAMGDE